MRILVVLTYYRPHTSGLTIYAERLANAFVQRGHSVTVLTSQYERDLPREEIQHGVKIIRVPVLFRVSKGVIMPSFGLIANRLVLENDVIQLHLPQFDAAGITLRGWITNKPTVITYHCDVRLPPGMMSWVANIGVRVMNNLAALFTDRIVTYTRDYAENSAYLRRYMNKLHVIPPPVVLPEVSANAISSFNQEHNPSNRFPVIGMAARFATEKGIEVLLDAMPRILAAFPSAMVQFAGPYKNIVGEEQYFNRLYPQIKKYEQNEQWKFLGVLNPEQMACFFPNIHVFLVPSLNSTEAFGLVQIEAMANGVPVIASDLPGVRQPVKIHKMGEIIPIGDSNALAEKLIKVLKNAEDYRHDPASISRQYLPDTIASEYEKLFDEIRKGGA